MNKIRIKKTKKKYDILDTIEYIFSLSERGKLLWYIEGIILFLTVFFVIIGVINFSGNQKTVVYSSEKPEIFHVKKVSEIPQKKQKEEKEKIAINEDKLTQDEFRNRYLSYVVSKIETVKKYPLSEQKKGHEGSVLVEITIYRNGKIEKVRLLRQARYVKLTKAAITSIRSALPFEKFPEKLNDEAMVFKLEIKFYLDQ